MERQVSLEFLVQWTILQFGKIILINPIHLKLTGSLSVDTLSGGEISDILLIYLFPNTFKILLLNLGDS